MDEQLDVNTQIRKFKELIDELYMDQLLQHISSGNEYLVINFADISKYDVELAEILLEQPEEVIRAAELAIKEMTLFDDVKTINVRISNLPSSIGVLVRNIRSKHLGKFISLLGTVRQKSDVRPRVTSARFECPSCGNIINVIQMDTKFKEPTKCACGRKGKFRLLSKELIDAQGLVIEEAAE